MDQLELSVYFQYFFLHHRKISSRIRHFQIINSISCINIRLKYHTYSATNFNLPRDYILNIEKWFINNSLISIHQRNIGTSTWNTALTLVYLINSIILTSIIFSIYEWENIQIFLPLNPVIISQTIKFQIW